MSEELADVIIEPYRKIIIHEIVEYRLNDLVNLILTGTRAVGGTTIPMLQWANGVVFQITPFDPQSEVVIEEQLKGIIHLANVTFAIKEKFEAEVRTSQGTLNLIDASATGNFNKVAETLKARSKFR